MENVTLVLLAAIPVFCVIAIMKLYGAHKEITELLKQVKSLDFEKRRLERQISRTHCGPIPYTHPERSTPSVEAFAEEARQKVVASRRWSDGAAAPKPPISHWPEEWDNL